MDFEKIVFITQKFFIGSKVLNIYFINSGLINKTYVVEHLNNGIKSKFILQRLSNIFESPNSINKNHKLISDHIKEKINNSYFDGKRWVVPSLIRCKSNNLFSFYFESVYWRAMIFIDEVFSLDCLEDQIMAYQTGIGLAKFHLLCSDFDCTKLDISMKNFHNTSFYINRYLPIVNNYSFDNLELQVNKRVNDLIESISIHIDYVESLLKSIGNNLLDFNVIHGDPKLSNFLFDNKYKYVVSLIDLDTLSKGYYLTDLADCIRSICNSSGEDPDCIDNVNFDMNAFKYFLKGYFSLTNQNKNCSFRLLPEFIYLIIFELTIRFLTDFLQSNIYFEIKYKTHNLYRAEVQFRLLSSFLTQAPDLSNHLHQLGISSSSNFVSDVQKFL